MSVYVDRDCYDREYEDGRCQGMDHDEADENALSNCGRDDGDGHSPLEDLLDYLNS